MVSTWDSVARPAVTRAFIPLEKLYGNVETIEERHRHRYEVNPEKVDALEKAGLKFVGHDTEGRRMEILELEGLWPAPGPVRFIT